MRHNHFGKLATVALVALLPSCASKIDRPPQWDRTVSEKYHHCQKCGSLEGGLYGKGPVKEFAGPGKEHCIHEWQKITRERFKQLGTELYQCDWSCEIPFFAEDELGIVPPRKRVHDIPLLTPEDSLELVDSPLE